MNLRRVIKVWKINVWVCILLVLVFLGYVDMLGLVLVKIVCSVYGLGIYKWKKG